MEWNEYKIYQESRQKVALELRGYVCLKILPVVDFRLDPPLIDITFDALLFIVTSSYQFIIVWNSVEYQHAFNIFFSKTISEKPFQNGFK